MPCLEEASSTRAAPPRRAPSQLPAIARLDVLYPRHPSRSSLRRRPTTPPLRLPSSARRLQWPPPPPLLPPLRFAPRPLYIRRRAPRHFRLALGPPQARCSPHRHPPCQLHGHPPQLHGHPPQLASRPELLRCVGKTEARGATRAAVHAWRASSRTFARAVLVRAASPLRNPSASSLAATLAAAKPT